MTERASFVCSHVFADTRPVLLVVREDGDWSFLCGGLHGESPENYLIVGINHLLDRDPSLREILRLGDNSEAERDAVGAPWRISPHSPG